MKRVAWISLGWLAVASVHAASFDCRKAAAEVEKLICRDAELSRLDEEMGARYKAALRDEPHAKFLRWSQKRWVTLRNSCHDAACLKQAYEDQLELLGIPIVTTPVGKQVVKREYANATLLEDGRVLISGGCIDKDNPDPTFRAEPDVDARAELFDTRTRRFTPTGEMQLPRRTHTGIRLPNGKVLILGGALPTFGNAATAPELYDPASGQFGYPGAYDCDLLLAYGTPTLLPGGRVLVTSWKSYGGGHSAKIYDPAKGGCTPTGEMITPRRGGSAIVLANGKVLLSGGGSYGDSGHADDYLRSSELYDPAAGTFSASGEMVLGRSNPALMRLPNGEVLVAGGGSNYENPMHTVELYDPATGQFTRAGKLTLEAAEGFLQKDGQVLFAGRPDKFGDELWLELYNPATATSRIVGRVPSFLNGIQLRDGMVLFLGADYAEIYDPEANGTSR